MNRAATTFIAQRADLVALSRLDPGSGDAARRAKWLVLFYRSGAYRDVAANGDALNEAFGISERTLDTCFEMGDSGDVLAEFMPVVLSDGELTAAVRRDIGDASFDVWVSKSEQFRRQPTLF